MSTEAQNLVEPELVDDYVGINQIIDAALVLLSDYGTSKTDHD